MTIRGAWIGVASLGLALLGPAGCRCASDPAPVGREVEGNEVPLTPPPVASELPAERPKRFSVSYARETDVGTSEHLVIANLGARQGSKRLKRSVFVLYSPAESLIDDVYGKLRAFACDKVETELNRGAHDRASTLQLTAGALRKMVNDKAPFHPTQAWVGAYEGCTTAMDKAFPDPGSTGYAELELRFPAENPANVIAIEIDLGPDHRGIEWRDDDATAIVYVAKVRPVDVEVSSGGGKTSVTCDLATRRGVEIAVKPDAAEDELAVEVTPIDEAAKVKGDIATGTNARVAALGAPRPNLAGEPAPPRAKRVTKAATDAKASPPTGEAGAGADERKAEAEPE